MWFSKELKAKIYRIEELKNAGLNTPKMFYVPINAESEVIKKAMDWAHKIHIKNPEQIFNIRTYNYIFPAKKESAQTVHLTDINFDDLFWLLQKTNNEYHCMIDAETPNNGRWAGNIVITENEIGRPVKYIIDYCTKPLRAMVRDADKHMEGEIARISELGTPLAMVIREALKFPKKNVVLEWTQFSTKAGIKDEYLVFWEYRNFEG